MQGCVCFAADARLQRFAGRCAEGGQGRIEVHPFPVDVDSTAIGIATDAGNPSRVILELAFFFKQPRWLGRVNTGSPPIFSYSSPEIVRALSRICSAASRNRGPAGEQAVFRVALVLIGTAGGTLPIGRHSWTIKRCICFHVPNHSA